MHCVRLQVRHSPVLCVCSKQSGPCTQKGCISNLHVYSGRLAKGASCMNELCPARLECRYAATFTARGDAAGGLIRHRVCNWRHPM